MIARNQTRFSQQITVWGLSMAILLCSAWPALAQPTGDRDAAVQHLRDVLEQPFLEAGGFSAFDCAISSSEQAAYPFTCDAARPTGEHYQYLLVPDQTKGLRVDLITEPASQINYLWLPAMQAACKQFLLRFNQADWESMYAGFDASLQKLVTVTRIESDLAPMRELLGPTGEPTLETYSLRNGGRSELQYSVPAKNGKAAFRCGLHATENTMTILAYLIAPYPDTSVYRAHLEENAARQLSDLIGDEVSTVEIPYQQLPDVYDSADGVAILANGERVSIRVSRSGRADDFSQYDYTFSIFQEAKP